jgi:ferric-dicitrate binding protein FerR (iron transport regulator)
MDDIMTDAQKRERHAAWLKSFGFSDQDWRRMKDLAERVTGNANPPALIDLSVPIRVAACPPKDARHFNGRLLGVHAGAALLYWPMSEREVESWTRRVRPLAPRTQKPPA